MMPGEGNTPPPQNAPTSTSAYESRYKNWGRTSDELRRNREEDTVQLRKQKREDQLAKRRNVTIEPNDLSEFDLHDVTEQKVQNSE